MSDTAVLRHFLNPIMPLLEPAEVKELYQALHKNTFSYFVASSAKYIFKDDVTDESDNRCLEVAGGVLEEALGVVDLLLKYRDHKLVHAFVDKFKKFYLDAAASMGVRGRG